MNKIISVIATAALIAPFAVGAQTGGWVTISGHVSLANAGDRLTIEANGVELYSVSASQTPVIMAGGEYIGYVTNKEFEYSVDVNSDLVKGSVQTYITSNGVKKLK